MPADREVVEVTQADREAAAELLVLRTWADMASQGACDDHVLVQAFARHRQASTASLNARVEKLEKGLESIDARLWQIHGTRGKAVMADCLKDIERTTKTLLSESPSNV